MVTLAAFGQATLKHITSSIHIFFIMMDIAEWINLIAEKIVDEFSVLRIALVLQNINTPVLGGAAPCVAPTLRKRGPPTLLTGLGGRLPTWTLNNSLFQICKNMLTTVGTCRANGPAARRAVAAMAMAHEEVMEVVRAEAAQSELQEYTMDPLAADPLNADPTTAPRIADVTGLVGHTGSFTPLHSEVHQVKRRTYGVDVCCPARAARRVAGNSSVD